MISELKGETVMEKLEPEINMPMSAFIPEDYIPDIDQRLFAYRRLAKMTGLNEISAFKEELIDRYGHLPNEAANLLLKIMLRTLSIMAGVKRLDITGKYIHFHFSRPHQKRPGGIVDMLSADPETYKFTPENILKARISSSNPNLLMIQAKNILKEIIQHVNG